MDNMNRTDNSCIVRNYQKLRIDYKALLDKNNRLEIENKRLKDLNEHKSMKIQQMNTSYFSAIKRYDANEKNYLKEVEFLKNKIISCNVYRKIAPVVPETSLQKEIINCDSTEIVTYKNDELFSLVMNLNGQLNDNAEVINYIVSKAENIRSNLVDAAKKSIEKDNTIKEITLEMCQLRQQYENARVEIRELSNSNRIQVENLQARLAVDSYEFIKVINSLKREKNKILNNYDEMKFELSRIEDECNLLKFQVENRNDTIVNNDKRIDKLRNDNSSLEKKLIIQEEIFKNNVILHDAEIYKHKDTIFNLESKIKKHNELHNFLQIKYDKLQDENKELKVKCSDQNKQLDNYVKMKIDFNILKLTKIQIVNEKNSKIDEIMGMVSNRVGQLLECVKQKHSLQSELSILNKTHSKLSKEFNRLNDKHQKLKTQFDEQTETIKSNKEMEKLLMGKLDSVKEVLGAEINTLKQRVFQLTEELSHSKVISKTESKTPANNVGLTTWNSNLKTLKKGKKVIFTSNEPIAIRGRKPVLKIVPDKENKNTEIENNLVGNDLDRNILQAEENSIIDTAEKEKEKSEENPNNLIKERKQNSFPCKTPIRPNKPDKEIMTNPSMVRNQIKYNTQCYRKKPQQAIKRPFR